MARVGKITKNTSAAPVDFLKITAATACKVTLYLTVSDNGYGSNRLPANGSTSKITAKIGTANAVDKITDIKARNTFMAVEVTLAAGDVCTIAMANGNGSDAYVQLGAIVYEDVV